MFEPARLRARAAPPHTWSNELHPFNPFYGHDAVLKRYTGMSRRNALKATIEHGLTLDDVVPAMDRRLSLPAYLTQSDRRASVVARVLPGVDVVAIGPLIRYAEALEPAGRQTSRGRVVLFPAHSIDTAQAEFDVVQFLDATAARRAAYDETVVCLYWRDVQLGRGRDYREAGLACTTAGHLRAPDFLFRLLEVLRSAQLVITNEPGTHLAYAVLLGVPVWLVPQHVEYAMTRRTPAEVLEARGQPGANERVAQLRRLFDEPVQAPTEEQVAFIRELTGDHHVRAPGELREILERAQTAYAAWPRRRRARLRSESVARSIAGLVRASTGARS